MSIIGHRIDCKGVGAMRGQRPYPAKINPALPSKRDIHWCYFCNGCQIQSGGNAGSGSLQRSSTSTRYYRPCSCCCSLGQNIILDREIFSKLYEIISVFFKVRPFVEIFVSRLIMIPKLLAFFQCILQSKKFKSI